MTRGTNQLADIDAAAAGMLDDIDAGIDRLEGILSHVGHFQGRTTPRIGDLRGSAEQNVPMWDKIERTTHGRAR